MRRGMEFGGGNVEQDKEETTDWQEAMQGVKFQGVKTFKSGGNEFLIPPTPEAETSEALKNPGIIGTFKNFLAEKFGSKKAGTGLFGLLGKQGANLSSLYGAGAGQEKIKIPGVDDGNGANEAVSDVAESINEIFQNDYTHEVVGQMADEGLRPPIWDVKRVSEKLGSNEGGWFEKQNGEKYYVKFYENPNQGRAEFIANAIYEKAGIKAAHTERVLIGGREAIASAAVENARSAAAVDQAASFDVQNGFVADAFLANWDVVGATYDNIVQNKDGLYRIDNGGSLIFRAQGGDKEFSAKEIPEIDSMRIRGRQTGEVFSGITEEEIQRQAQEFVQKVQPEDILSIVNQSGISGKARERVLQGLLGRREYLVNKYTDENDKRETAKLRRRVSVSEALQGLKNQELEKSYEGVLRMRTEVICDRDHIEGQRIDIIDKSDVGLTEVRLKVRDHSSLIAALKRKYLELEDRKQELNLAESETKGADEKIYVDKFVYEGVNNKRPQELCQAFVLQKGDIKVYIADPTKRARGRLTTIYTNNNQSGLVRSALGLVKIEMPAGMDPIEIEQTVDEILEKDLGINNALSEVTEEAAQEYKESRLKWQYKIEGELSVEEKERAERLERKEVFPGYSTLVEEGKYLEYLEKYGDDLRAIHNMGIASAEDLKMVFTQGLMCTTERFSRGLMRGGLSSVRDMDSGGADNVFTRIMGKEKRAELGGVVLILKPEIFDRTDWYSYSSDTYGSTDRSEFKKRMSPDEVFDFVANSGDYIRNNEQMFRMGIGAEYIEGVEVDAQFREEMIESLRNSGIEEINGRRIEEIIIARNPVVIGASESLSSGTDMEWNKPVHDVDKASGRSAEEVSMSYFESGGMKIAIPKNIVIAEEK